MMSLASPQDMIRIEQKRGLTLPHLPLMVLRKPDVADAQITAHAYSAETALQSFRIIY